MTEQTKKQPEHKVRRGTSQVAIWQNLSKDGEVYHTFGLEHSYKDQKGKWQTEKISLFPEEALRTASALMKAHDDFHDFPQFRKVSDEQTEATEQAA